MPVRCAIDFPRLSENEMRDVDYLVMRHAFDIHRDLGCLCDEVVYQNRLAASLRSAGFLVAYGVPVSVSFRSFFKTLFLDLVVNQSVVYELKTVAKLDAAHISQLLNYLFLTEASRGKLINFRPTSVESRFVNSTLDASERRQFAIDSSLWAGPSSFSSMIEDLVSDWGTGLDQSLYADAMIHELGGADAVTHQLPMQLDGLSLGNQRFQLLDDKNAFRITTFQKPSVGHYETSIRKLLVPSSLSAIHWVNIGRHEILLRSIPR